jgi:hypothetical protein
MLEEEFEHQEALDNCDVFASKSSCVVSLPMGESIQLQRTP